MSYAVLIAFTLSSMLVATGEDAPKPSGKNTKQAPGAKSHKKRQSTNTVTFTGCVDQKGEDYVLTGDEELKAIAVLHGDGFTDDNFARHLGHKVTVEGNLMGDAEPKQISVKHINDIADTCEPK